MQGCYVNDTSAMMSCDHQLVGATLETNPGNGSTPAGALVSSCAALSKISSKSEVLTSWTWFWSVKARL